VDLSWTLPYLPVNTNHQLPPSKLVEAKDNVIASLNVPEQIKSNMDSINFRDLQL
jgi:hypothetical protein